MTKIKVLILNQNEGLNGVTWWRLYRPFTFLQDYYPDHLEITYSSGALQTHDLLQHDVYYFLRPYLPEHLQALEALHALGRAMGRSPQVILDFDDDNSQLPKYHLNYVDEGAGWDITRRCLKLASQIWASTPQIADTYGRAAGVPAYVIPNAVSEWDLPLQPTPAAGRRVWWGGSMKHQHDLLAHEQDFYKIEAAASRLLFSGYLPPFRINEKKTEYRPLVPVLNYFEALHQYAPTMIWKPLKAIPFNNAKSNIAWLTATCHGAICVTNYAGRPGWEFAAPAPVWNANEAVKIWEESREAVLKGYNLADWTKQRFRCISSLVNVELQTA